MKKITGEGALMMLIIKTITKTKAVLKSKSGASLMFVLGIMLLLLAIAGSIMAAASANIGANVRQDRYNRAVLLTDSVHRSIKHSLEAMPNTEAYIDNEFANSLAFQIARAIYENADAPNDTVELNIDIAGVDMSSVNSITLDITYQDIKFNGPIEAVPETNPPMQRIPRTATISAQMNVCVVVEVDTASLRDTPQLITTVASYELSGAVLSDTNASGEIGEMIFSDFGKWVLKSYEIIESETIKN